MDKKSEPDEKNENEKLLQESFLCAIKFKQKELELPVLASTLEKIMHTCW